MRGLIRRKKAEDSFDISMEEAIFRLNTRRKLDLLAAMMRSLASENSKISFEGKLSHTELVHLPGACSAETETLKRATLWPRLDFVVLTLVPQNPEVILDAVTSKIAIGERGIIHVQIEHNGKIAFAAYDGFQHAVAHSAFPPALMQELTDKGVLWGYQREV